MTYATVALGTAPAGSDGDTVRSAFGKVNTLLSDINNRVLGKAFSGVTETATGTLPGWNLAVQQSGAITLAATGALGDFVWIWNVSGSPQTVTAPSGGFIYDPHANTGSNTTVITLQDGQDVVIMCRGGASEMDVMGGAYLWANGNVVIGASAPSTVRVLQTKNQHGLMVDNTANGSGSNGPELALMGDGSSTPNKFVRASGGSLQVVNSGYSAPIFSLSDTGYGTFNAGLTVGGNGGAAVAATSAAAGQYRQTQFQTNGSPRWNIQADSSAESGSNAGSNFQIVALSDSGATLGNALSIARSSQIVTFAQSIVNGSDIALKQDVVTLDNALAKIEAMRGVYYARKDAPDVRKIGVIAQEVREVFPEAVHEGTDGVLGVMYADLVGPLIEAVKELSAQNKALVDRVEALEAA